jgi:hypothetical protein
MKCTIFCSPCTDTRKLLKYYYELIPFCHSVGAELKFFHYLEQ